MEVSDHRTNAVDRSTSRVDDYFNIIIHYSVLNIFPVCRKEIPDDGHYIRNSNQCNDHDFLPPDGEKTLYDGKPYWSIPHLIVFRKYDLFWCSILQ